MLPTRLYSTNRNVDAENDGELARLPGEAVEMVGKDTWAGAYTRPFFQLNVSTFRRIRWVASACQ